MKVWINFNSIDTLHLLNYVLCLCHFCIVFHIKQDNQIISDV